MTIVEHLEELRVRLLISLVAFGIATIVGYLFVERILALLLQPVGQVVFLAPTEAFFVRWWVAGIAGVFLSLPVILYQIWRFVAMGLTPTERRYTLSMIPVAAVLFVGGAAFAFLTILPFGIRFLLSYQTPNLVPMISIAAYTSFATAFVLSFGLLFQLPLVVVLLARLVIVTPAQLAAGRKYALLRVIAEAVAAYPGLSFLARDIRAGVDPPLTVDLRFLTFTIGATLRLNLAILIGIVIAVWIFRLLQ